MAGSIRVSRARHLRHRRLDGVERGGGVPRLKRLEAWLADRAADLAATPAATAFTAASTDIASAAAHGFATGEGPMVVATDGTLPAGLAADTLYWVGVIDAGTFYLYRSREDAMRDQNRVDVTDAGVGNHTIARAADIPGLIEFLRQDNDPRTIQALTDIDDL